MAPSDKQLDFLNSLLSDRVVPEHLRAEAEAVRDNGDRRDVSAMIDRLKDCPFPAREREQVEVRATEPGVYRLDGEVYIVTPNKAGTGVYAKRMVETGVQRVAEDGSILDGIDFVYARGAVLRLSPEDRMPFEDARALSTRYRRCIVCGAHLKARKSVEEGIGPVCAKRFPDRAMAREGNAEHDPQASAEDRLAVRVERLREEAAPSPVAGIASALAVIADPAVAAYNAHVADAARAAQAIGEPVEVTSFADFAAAREGEMLDAWQDDRAARLNRENVAGEMDGDDYGLADFAADLEA